MLAKTMSSGDGLFCNALPTELVRLNFRRETEDLVAIFNLFM